MRRGEFFPGDQAEIVFADPFIEYLAGLTTLESEAVLREVVALCESPFGKHPLSNRPNGATLAGWNTLDVLGGQHRVVFASRIINGIGCIDILCAGPRRANAVDDAAVALRATGVLNDDELQQIWQALAVLDVVAEQVGLDGWDYRPPAAPEGLIRAAVGSGLLAREVAELLSAPELQAAMTEGWSESGTPDPALALNAALLAARSGIDGIDMTRIVKGRAKARCQAPMPRAQSTCIRMHGHPGPHRSR